MGVRGFYSYIQEFVDAALTWHKLKNCKLVIDGNNLAHEIYSNSRGINSAFGGDYDKYATFIEDFFNKLSECNVDCVVVMDGGYPMQRNKFRTVYCRVTDQMDTCKRINPDNQDSMRVFPLMARSVFVCTIHKLGVRVLQADFEADDEIVVVAKKLGAYVLSNDSDFYLFDVPFILLHSVNMKHVQKDQTKEGKMSKFVPCYRFDIDKFSKITGVRRELMPLLAPLLGNDYFNPKSLVPFYKSISRFQPKSKRISDRKKLIISVIKWLAQQGGNTDAILNKLISSHCSNNKDNGLRKAFEMYFPTSSYLTPWIAQHQKSCSVKLAHIEANSGIEEHFLGVRNLVEELHCTCKSKCSNTILYNGELPDKFLRAYRLGLIPHSIVDLLTKNYFFTAPQIEETNNKDILYLTFSGLIKDLRALLWVTYARGDKNRTLETMDKNLSIRNSNIRSLTKNSSKQINSKETPNSMEKIVNNEESYDILKCSEGEEHKENSDQKKRKRKKSIKNSRKAEIENCDKNAVKNEVKQISGVDGKGNNSDKIRDGGKKGSLEDNENSKKNELRNECRQSSEEKENSYEISNDTENILRTNNKKGVNSDEKSIDKMAKNPCDEKRYNNEYIHEYAKEDQEKLEVGIKKEKICIGSNSLSFVVEKTSVKDDKDVSKETKVSKLCDVGSKAIKEAHDDISEQIDPIATLHMNYATSDSGFIDYNCISRSCTVNENNCDTSRNEIVSLTDCDTSKNETLNVNSCDASGNDFSLGKASERKLFPESGNDCDNEGLIPNKNYASCSDDGDIKDDLSGKPDEDEKYKETEVSKLCDVGSKSIKEAHHDISEQIDPIATLCMNYATSESGFIDYNCISRSCTINENNCDTFRNEIVSLTDCDTSRNEIVSLTDCDTSKNETLIVNSCDASGNDFSLGEASERKLFPESGNDCDTEGLIPNKNYASCSDGGDIKDDLSGKPDEDEEYKVIKNYVNSDDDEVDDDAKEGENKEDAFKSGNIQKLRPYEILFIPPIRMFYKGNNSFKVKHFPQEDITLYDTLPSLFEIQNFTEEKKMDLFYSFIDFKRESRTSLSIEFIILCIGFWKKHFFRHAKLNNILSVLVCIVMFNVIDGKLGRIRYKRSPEEVASFQRKINSMKQSGKFGDPSSMSVEELIESLTKEECKLASFNMNNLHNLDSKVDKLNYDRSVIHSFSEFQATVFFLQFLNSLLYFPFPVISMDSMWSGTFCYNVRNWLDRTNDVNILLATLFANNQRMEVLYVKLYLLVAKLTQIPSVETTFHNVPSYNKVQVMRKKLGIKKIPTKKCKKKKKENNQEKKVEYSTEELLLLAGNKFSTLAVI